MIYTLLFFGNNCNTFVCCWEPLKAPSLTYNILNSNPLSQTSWTTVNTTVFLLSKTISEEARDLFYWKGIFRFNSAQLATLLLLPQILDYLRELQLEDTLPNQRYWKLDAVFDRLSGLPQLKQVTIGATVLRESWEELRGIELRSYKRLCAKSLSQFNEMLKATVEEHDVCARRYEETHQMISVCLQQWVDNSIIQTNDFPSRNKPNVFAFELLEYPKVKFIHFRKKSEYEKSLNIYPTQ
ncbi:hypothetical protein MMC32_007886 [Xylographa parallela]|nr:hypothetical protein [Xylographa parallela]